MHPTWPRHPSTFRNQKSASKLKPMQVASTKTVQTVIFLKSNLTTNFELASSLCFPVPPYWEPGLRGPSPCWPVDPGVSAIETLSRHHLQIPVETHPNVTFLAVGTFNKLYSITASGDGGDNAFLHSRTHVCSCLTRYRAQLYRGQRTWL